jgi:hypothetical protein
VPVHGLPPAPPDFIEDEQMSEEKPKIPMTREEHASWLEALNTMRLLRQQQDQRLKQLESKYAATHETSHAGANALRDEIGKTLDELRELIIVLDAAIDRHEKQLVANPPPAPEDN